MSILAELRGAGLHLEAKDGGTVHVRPQELLTPAHRRAILSHKPDILAASDLERRIQAMALRWHYTADELAEALECSRGSPAAWLLAVKVDEERADLCRQIRHDYPSG